MIVKSHYRKTKCGTTRIKSHFRFPSKKRIKQELKAYVRVLKNLKKISESRDYPLVKADVTQTGIEKRMGYTDPAEMTPKERKIFKKRMKELAKAVEVKDSLQDEFLQRVWVTRNPEDWYKKLNPDQKRYLNIAMILSGIEPLPFALGKTWKLDFMIASLLKGGI